MQSTSVVRSLVDLLLSLNFPREYTHFSGTLKARSSEVLMRTCDSNSPLSDIGHLENEMKKISFRSF